MSNTIIRAPRRHRFVTIDQSAVEDSRLSWAARGLLGYLLSRPDDWKVLVCSSVATWVETASTVFFESSSMQGMCAIAKPETSTAVTSKSTRSIASRTRGYAPPSSYSEPLDCVEKRPIKFNPQWADHGDRIVLKATWTKGGKQREIPITNDRQRAALDHAHRTAGRGSLIEPNRRYVDQLRIYERHTANAGLSKLHGLRYLYAQQRYEEQP